MFIRGVGRWGDSNVVVNRDERIGSVGSSRSSEMKGFVEFIADSKLIDVQCKGKGFNWFSSDGKSMNRLDRFLLSDSVISRWGIFGQLIGRRDISGHFPIWLVVYRSNWGPKPFMVNYCWFEDNKFMPFVERESVCVAKLEVRERSNFVLKKKLCLLKFNLRRWNEDVFGRCDLEIEEGILGINKADSLLASCRENKVMKAVARRSATTRCM